ncbi:hypothetical protein FWD20_00235 [Candidatus Saccharibacteria bacterium]|nr:hypothetical protein [Candidatus Saccharibacteria bacterium]
MSEILKKYHEPGAAGWTPDSKLTDEINEILAGRRRFVADVSGEFATRMAFAQEPTEAEAPLNVLLDAITPVAVLPIASANPGIAAIMALDTIENPPHDENRDDWALAA